MVLRQGLRQVAFGLAIGLLLAIAMAAGMASVLYQVEPWDPVTFVGIPLLLLAVAVFACLVPARRAAAVEPSEALRGE